MNNFITEPGPHEIVLKKHGIPGKTTEINLDKYEQKDINIEMTETIDKKIVLQTFPSGADIYIDSEWRGVSPLRLDIYSSPSAVRIKKSGYEENNFFITEDTTGIIEINLKPDVLQRDEFVPGTKEKVL